MVRHLASLRLCSRWFSLILVVIGLVACTAVPAETPAPTPPNEFVFGVILVGPQDDHGWSEAHYNGGRYVEAHMDDSRMVFLDNLNPNTRPDTTLEKAVDNMIAEGAQMVFITSDDFAADTLLVAQKYTDTTFIHVSGDHVLKGSAPANLGNYMGRIEFGKILAGCAAALTTNTGRIAYLGPLINDETRRLANATYLGARYCYEHYRDQDPDDLLFHVEWIGFWFHIPGVTADPTVVSHQLFDQGADVLISGIDTTEAIVVAGARAKAGETLWAIPFDYEGACEEAPEVCLGVPYFNWGPGYLQLAQEVRQGTWESHWEWAGPDWRDINNPETSAVGFFKGSALGEEHSAQLDEVVDGLANGSLVFFKGPLRFQNGEVYLAEGEVATDEQIWYMPHLLEKMEGLSE